MRVPPALTHAPRSSRAIHGSYAGMKTTLLKLSSEVSKRKRKRKKKASRTRTRGNPQVSSWWREGTEGDGSGETGGEGEGGRRGRNRRGENMRGEGRVGG